MVMVDATKDILKKEQRDFKEVLQSAKSFVQWAHNHFEDNESEIVIESELPEIRIRRKRKLAGEETDDAPPTTTIAKFEVEVHNVAMDCVLTKVEESFSKSREVCEDFVCLDPRNFLTPLPSNALDKLMSLLGYESAVMREELFLFFTEMEGF